MQVFCAEDDFRMYLRALLKYKYEFGVLIYHYCLMSNHIHLLVKVSAGEGLKRFMQGVNQTYSHYYKRTYKHFGHLWQGRYKSFLIEKDSYLLDCGRYIERNPVRARLVRNPADWSWSSYREHAFGEGNPIVETHGIYLDLGRTAKERQANYRNYILTERPYEQLIDKQFEVAV
ncbi:MAG: transposase [Candidatus Omnitrophica bacterium CG11_big_fil_rev_8_21_14_0_20_45_26]|uniref:Transposase n=1 Tax=Candidatus Abzuiibacterium crystallinum TaxID=1974748 RepID=A0A2H0LNX3_9BACT|nr:MAG: transposase [Candidatus Omnitrophica bacterium CG11_big_fil_rev_8_21_14_0_20_45_26]PIW64922.1 MAG: transposase [Candidatus Omnitrophica bacterium CG12_big_fil_rev_8_21_14_0_65_45_16]